MIAIHQPDHMPWLGYFHKLHCADNFIILDNVQFKKNNFQNRNRIYTANGLLWTSVPVKMKGHMSSVISDMEVVPGWKKKYLKTLYFNYKKADYFHEITALLDLIEKDSSPRLIDLNMNIIRYFIHLLEIEVNLIFSSELDNIGQKTELLVHLIQQVSETQYLSGRGGLDYLESDLFQEKNIDLVIQHYSSLIYKPFNYPDMTDAPGIIDVVANLGSETVKKHLDIEKDKQISILPK